MNFTMTLQASVNLLFVFLALVQAKNQTFAAWKLFNSDDGHTRQSQRHSPLYFAPHLVSIDPQHFLTSLQHGDPIQFPVKTEATFSCALSTFTTKPLRLLANNLADMQLFQGSCNGRNASAAVAIQLLDKQQPTVAVALVDHVSGRMYQIDPQPRNYAANNDDDASPIFTWDKLLTHTSADQLRGKTRHNARRQEEESSLTRQGSFYYFLSQKKVDRDTSLNVDAWLDDLIITNPSVESWNTNHCHHLALQTIDHHHDHRQAVHRHMSDLFVNETELLLQRKQDLFEAFLNGTSIVYPNKDNNKQNTDGACPAGILLPDLTYPDGGGDVFRIAVVEGDVVTCTTSGPTSGDVDLFMRDPQGVSCGSTGFTANEFCVVDATADGDMIVELQVLGGVTNLQLSCQCSKINTCGDGLCDPSETCESCRDECGDCGVAASCPSGITATGLLMPFRRGVIDFTMNVAEGDIVTCRTSEGISGNANLEMSFGFAGVNLVTCVDNLAGNDAICALEASGFGSEMSIDVVAGLEFDGVRLDCTCSSRGTCGDSYCDSSERCDTCTIECGSCGITGSCPAGISVSGIFQPNVGRTVDYELSVQAGQIITCTTSGGTGDADLRMSVGGQICLDDASGNNAFCVLEVFSDAVMDIEVIAAQPFDNLQVVCACSSRGVCGDGICDTTETCASCVNECGSCGGSGVCPSGINRTGLFQPNIGGSVDFAMSLSTGDIVTCRTVGGTGEANLLMSFGDDSCFNNTAGNDECALEALSNGVMSIEVQASSPWSGLQLECSCTERGTCGDNFCDSTEICSCTQECGSCDGSRRCPFGLNETNVFQPKQFSTVEYTIGLPPDFSITCFTFGGEGNLDLFMSQGGSTTCASRGFTNSEQCISSVSLTDSLLKLTLSATRPFSGVTLICTCEEQPPESTTCFPGSAVVTTRGPEDSSLLVEALKVGTEVLTYGDAFVTVYDFGHYKYEDNDADDVQYLQLSVTLNDDDITESTQGILIDKRLQSSYQWQIMAIRVMMFFLVWGYGTCAKEAKKAWHDQKDLCLNSKK